MGAKKLLELARKATRDINIRDGTIMSVSGVEIDLRSEDYRRWITIKTNGNSEVDASYYAACSPQNLIPILERLVELDDGNHI